MAFFWEGRLVEQLGFIFPCLILSWVFPSCVISIGVVVGARINKIKAV